MYLLSNFVLKNQVLSQLIFTLRGCCQFEVIVLVNEFVYDVSLVKAQSDGVFLDGSTAYKNRPKLKQDIQAFTEAPYLLYTKRCIIFIYTSQSTERIRCPCRLNMKLTCIIILCCTKIAFTLSNTIEILHNFTKESIF